MSLFGDTGLHQYPQNVVNFIVNHIINEIFRKVGNNTMLMDIKCSAVASIKVNLTFDDMSTKERVVGVGDLVDITYNANGLRKHIEGRVLKVSVVGVDPNGWYIIVDGSDDFDSDRVKFSPMNILDIEIIRKADTLENVQTVIGAESVPFIRIVKGRLQYSKDGYNWRPINIDKRDIIEPQEGTVPIDPPPCEHNESDDENDIDDANY